MDHKKTNELGEGHGCLAGLITLITRPTTSAISGPLKEESAEETSYRRDANKVWTTHTHVRLTFVRSLNESDCT